MCVRSDSPGGRAYQYGTHRSWGWRRANDGDETGLFLYHKMQKKYPHSSPAAQLKLPGQLLWPELPFVLRNEQGDNVFTVPNSNEGFNCACLYHLSSMCSVMEGLFCSPIIHNIVPTSWQTLFFVNATHCRPFRLNWIRQIGLDIIDWIS